MVVTSAAPAHPEARSSACVTLELAMHPMQQVLPAEAELKEERANSLKLATLALEEAIGFWRDADDAITAQFDDARRRAIAERDRRRVEVERLLWNLVVQREALGLAHHDGLWVTFGLPSDLQPHPHLRG
jgi:hypothetical protein